MSSTQTANATAATPLPCAACKQPVIEKRSADGALVVLDAATKRLHLCLKRKEVEAAKAKQIAASRVKGVRPKPLPPAKRVEMAMPAGAAQPTRPPAKPFKGRGNKPARPVREKPAPPPQKTSRRAKPRKTTLRSPEQVAEILKGRVVRWRTGDGPTSFCDHCGAPVLAGFSHVRWDVMMLDAVGHRPHDCETARQAAAALRSQSASRIDVPELVVDPARLPARALAPVAPIKPSIKVETKPRRRPREHSPSVTVNSCETCGKLKAVVNGEWVCLHC